MSHVSVFMQILFQTPLITLFLGYPVFFQRVVSKHKKKHIHSELINEQNSYLDLKKELKVTDKVI